MSKAPAPQSQNFGRCHYLSPAARRCRLNILERDGSYCPRHQGKQHRPGDFAMPLAHHSLDFRNARGISNSLRALYHLLAANHISARRASTLAYISSLMLRSLRDIQPEPLPPSVTVRVFPQNDADLQKILSSIKPTGPYEEQVALAENLAQQYPPPPEPTPDSRQQETPDLSPQRTEALSTRKPN
jgi:hypothetical protein